MAHVDLLLVGELAIWSFHELAKEEANWKRERGEEFKLAQRMTIKSCKRNANSYKQYASLPEYAPGIIPVNEAFSELVELNARLAEQSHKLLERAENSAVFDSRRLGSNWNCLYLVLLKYYISSTTGWNRTEVMGVITHLVAAAHDAVKRPRQANLRVLLQKAIRHYEHNTENATSIALVKAVVANPRHLYEMFPKVPVSNQPAA